MGKKKKIKKYPQKFGRKFSSHPVAKALAKLKDVRDKALEDGVITAVEAVEIEKAQEEVLEAAVNSVTEQAKKVTAPVVEKAQETLDKAKEVLSSLDKKPAKKAPKAKKSSTPKKTTRKIAKSASKKDSDG